MDTRQPDDDSSEFYGTIYGSYDYNFEGKGAWVGHAILVIDGKPPVKTTFADRNTSINRKAEGGIYGTEVITFSFPDNGTLQVIAKFTGTPASTPGLYTLHETGRIANGTGAYSRASGHVVVQGPFLLPDPEIAPGAPAWIAEMHGVLRGI